MEIHGIPWRFFTRDVNILQFSALSLLRVLKCTILSAIAVKVSVYCSAQELNGRTQDTCSLHTYKE